MFRRVVGRLSAPLPIGCWDWETAELATPAHQLSHSSTPTRYTPGLGLLSERGDIAHGRRSVPYARSGLRCLR